MRLSNVEVTQGGRRRDLTVVEAVNANRPFLLDSTLAELVARGYRPRLVAHPILGVERDGEGALVQVVGETTAQETRGGAGGEIDAGGLARESFIHVHLDRIDDEAAQAALQAGLTRIYADVAVTAADHGAMVERLAEAAASYADAPCPLAPEEREEARAFLDWLRDGHFVLLGLREYRDAGGADHAGVPGSGLGLLRDPAVEVLRRGDAMVAVTPEIRAFLEGPEALMVTKASLRSRVRRQAHLDMVAIKLFARDGGLAGELRLVGLFTGSAYASRAEEVPYLRRKVAAVLRKAGLDPTSHAGRSLVHVLETYPRDDLFQIEPGLLLRFALAIVSLADRPRVRVLARPDKFGRFVSLIAYLPKDRTDARLQARIGAYLAEALGGRLSTIAPDYPEGPLARLHVIVATPGAPPRRSMRPRSRPASRSWPAPGPMRCARPCPRPAAATPAASRRSMPTPSRRATARCMPAPRRCPTSPSWSGSRRPSPGRSTSSAAPATPRPASASRCFPVARRSPSPSGCRSWRISASGSSTSAPTASSPRAPAPGSSCTTWCWNGPAADGRRGVGRGTGRGGAARARPGAGRIGRL